MKALLHYRASKGFRALLDSARPEWLDIVVVDEADDTAFANEMADAHAVLHVLRPLGSVDMDLATNLGLIQKIGVGVNTIDLQAAESRGIAVANMPGTNNPAVAETALLLMLAAFRRATYFDRLTRAGSGWRAEAEAYDEVGEIGGKTIGLVGYGAVPQHLAPILQAMGAEVLYTATGPKDHAVGRYCSLEELVRQSDVISLHVPLTPETDQLFDANMFGKMKPGVVLVNTARGGLVDEAALVQALRSGHVRAAGLDVFAEEPVDPSNPLLSMDNVTCLPHLAWLTPETLQRSLDICIENCRRLRDGEPILHQVI